MRTDVMTPDRPAQPASHGGTGRSTAGGTQAAPDPDARRSPRPGRRSRPARQPSVPGQSRPACQPDPPGRTRAPRPSWPDSQDRGPAQAAERRRARPDQPWPGSASRARRASHRSRTCAGQAGRPDVLHHAAAWPARRRPGLPARGEHDAGGQLDPDQQAGAGQRGPHAADPGAAAGGNREAVGGSDREGGQQLRDAARAGACLPRPADAFPHGLPRAGPVSQDGGSAGWQRHNGGDRRRQAAAAKRRPGGPRPGVPPHPAGPGQSPRRAPGGRPPGLASRGAQRGRPPGPAGSDPPRNGHPTSRVPSSGPTRKPTPRHRPARRGWPRRPLRRTSSARRLNVTLLSVAFAISVVMGRLVQLQGVDASRYRYLGHKERVTTQTTPAVRGEITSSDGAVLAMTVRTDTVYADPPLINKSTTLANVASRLAGLLQMQEGQILWLLQNPSSPDYVILKHSVVASTADAISKLGLPGVALTPAYQRSYPAGDLAAPLLGFTHTEQSSGVMTGQAGLELAYNSLLTGRSGTVVYEKGTNGLPIPGTESTVKAAAPAGNLRLTIQ